jgi:hypothetical protein
MPRTTVLHHKQRLCHYKQKIAREQISQWREQVEWKKKKNNKSEEARVRVRGRRRGCEAAVAATSEEQLKLVDKVCKKMKSSVQVGRPQTRRFQE